MISFLNKGCQNITKDFTCGTDHRTSLRPSRDIREQIKSFIASLNQPPIQFCIQIQDLAEYKSLKQILTLYNLMIDQLSLCNLSNQLFSQCYSK